MEKDQKNIFEYLDYRQFLRDWYQAKRNTKEISLRLFSQKAGFTSPNFLKLVMDGERNLTGKSLEKFATALELNKQESVFFHNLVRYNQAKNLKEKDEFYQLLLQSPKFNQLKPIAKENYVFYSEWYHPVVRELVVASNFDGNLENLAQRIRPAITSQQVKKSIDLMEKIGFLSRDENGKWVQSQSIVTTGAEVNSHIVFKYHQNVLDVAKEILEQVSAQERDVSSLTLGIKKSQVSELKLKIQNFRREILQWVSQETNPEEVILLTMQMMPLTQLASEVVAS